MSLPIPCRTLTRSFESCESSPSVLEQTSICDPREEHYQKVRRLAAQLFSSECQGSVFSNYPASFPILLVGSELVAEDVQAKTEKETFAVGEFVGLSNPICGQMKLTFVRKICPDGLIECCGTDSFAFHSVPVFLLFKIRKIVITALLAEMFLSSRLSCESVYTLRNSPGDWFSSCGIGFPRLGTLVEESNLEEAKPTDEYVLGELVALQTSPATWHYARILSLLGLEAHCLVRSDDHEALPPLFPLSMLRKLRHYPLLAAQERTDQIEPAVYEHFPALSLLSFVQELESRIHTYMYLPPSIGLSPVILYTFVRYFDEQTLVQLMRATVSDFRQRIEKVSEERGSFGLFEEMLVEPGTTFFIAGDLHGNVSALLATLDMLKKQKYLDEHYHCMDRFCMIFLGDYVDRGVNSIQLLSLLLLLRRENPAHVILLRGNHDDSDPALRLDGSPMGELSTFFLKNRALVDQCVKSFPLALSVASATPYRTSRGEFQHQYVHFSHGLFSLSEDPSALLQGQNSISTISRLDMFSRFWEREEKVRKESVSQLATRFRNEPMANHPFGYFWSDIDETSHLSARGRGFAFSPDHIDLVRKSTETPAKKVCLFVRGHQHVFFEHTISHISKTVDRPLRHKVVAITLPITSSESLLFHNHEAKCIQGLFLTVASKVSDWKKGLVLARWDQPLLQPIFERDALEIGIYERFPIESW